MKYLSSFFIVLLILLNGCKNTQNSTNDKQRKNNPTTAITVKVSSVKKDSISEYLSLVGNISAFQTVNLASDIPGRVSKIYVKEGDKVYQGQLIAKLDDEAMILQMKQAEAGLLVAEANYRSAESDWNRMQELKKSESISPQQLEKVQLGFEAAKAQLQQAKTTLDLINYNISKTNIKAPFNGIITSVNVNEGELFNNMMPGKTGVASIVTLMDMDNVKIETSVSEKDFSNVAKGQSAYIQVDSYPDKIFLGKITNVFPSADPFSRTFKVNITVPNKDYYLRPGMYAKIKVITKTNKNTIVVPSNAVLNRDGKKIVMVAKINNGKKIAEEREVETGISTESSIEIIKGLSENEIIVIEGNYGLKNGTVIEY